MNPHIWINCLNALYIFVCVSASVSDTRRWMDAINVLYDTSHLSMTIWYSSGVNLLPIFVFFSFSFRLLYYWINREWCVSVCAYECPCVCLVARHGAAQAGIYRFWLRWQSNNSFLCVLRCWWFCVCVRALDIPWILVGDNNKWSKGEAGRANWKLKVLFSFLRFKYMTSKQTILEYFILRPGRVVRLLLSLTQHHNFFWLWDKHQKLQLII